jgi:hypothetical protein
MAAAGASVRKKVELFIVAGSIISEKGTVIIVLTGTPIDPEIGFIDTTVYQSNRQYQKRHEIFSQSSKITHHKKLFLISFLFLLHFILRNFQKAD